MATQDQFLRQDVVAQQNFEVLGNTQLGNDPSDVTSVVGIMTIGNTVIEPVAAADYGPGPLTNEVIYSFDGSMYDAAVCTVTVVDDANTDVYAATFTVVHNGSSAAISSATGVADLWGGTNPAFNANYNTGTVELRMDIADVVSVSVAVDVKLFGTQASEFITISGQPAADTTVEGEPGAFSVTASTNDGGTLSYQWEEDNGGGFAALSNNATYAGVTTATLAITTTNTSLNGYDYRCVVSSSGGSAPATSNSANFTVNAATVTISADPTNQSVTAPAAAQFTVTASTNETLSTLTYSWEEDQGSGFVALTNAGVYSGVDTDTLDISNSTGLNGYDYRCVVSTDSVIAPSATSAAATLTVA